MALSLRQIKRRIKSVENTKKITKAMQMVAAAKLRRYQALLGQTQNYATELERMLQNLITTTPSFQHPFFEVREPKRSVVLVITSDSGLCGSYNYNLFKTVDSFVSTHSEDKTFFSLGRQGLNYLKRKGLTLKGDLGIPRPNEIDGVIKTIMDYLTNAFLDHDVDQVFLIYTQFLSMASYKPIAQKLLPLSGTDATDDKKTLNPYILEPSAERILQEMIPHFLQLKVEQAVKGAFVSEQVSRMMAMRQATDNATEMIDSLTLQRNKARQTSITKELIEIVSGFKAQQQ